MRHPELTDSQVFAVHQLAKGEPWILSWDEFILGIDNTYRVTIRFGETVDGAVKRQMPKWLLLVLAETENPLPGLTFLWDIRISFRDPILDAGVVGVHWKLRPFLYWIPTKPLKLLYKLFKPFSDLALWILGRRLR